MTAYYFKRRFVEPIRRGLEPVAWIPGMKRQMIRRRREYKAQDGSELQLYCGMRTKGCFKIGDVVCVEVLPISIDLRAGKVQIADRALIASYQRLNAFAMMDGFDGFEDMRFLGL
jgi:hypothetical protein